MLSILAVAPVCAKPVSTPDDVRKGLILDQLENTGASMPITSMEMASGKWFHLNLLHISYCSTLG